MLSSRTVVCSYSQRQSEGPEIFHAYKIGLRSSAEKDACWNGVLEQLLAEHQHGRRTDSSRNHQGSTNSKSPFNRETFAKRAQKFHLLARAQLTERLCSAPEYLKDKICFCRLRSCLNTVEGHSAPQQRLDYPRRL